MSVPISDLSTVEEISDRLDVLHEKADRIARYNLSVEAGTPDVSLLDEKQQHLFATYARDGRRFPPRIHRTLRLTIDILKQKRRLVARDPERFERWAA